MLLADVMLSAVPGAAGASFVLAIGAGVLRGLMCRCDRSQGAAGAYVSLRSEPGCRAAVARHPFKLELHVPQVSFVQ